MCRVGPVAVVLFFLLNLAAASRNRIDKPCTGDSNCRKNEVCKFQTHLTPPCAQGTCQCKPCYAVEFPGEPCSPKKLKKPCDPDCSERQCDGSCTPGSLSEIYANNSQCLNDLWPGYFMVKCNECYKLIDGICVRQPEKTAPLNSECATDCDCPNTTSCLSKCQCPRGTNWDVNNKKCREPRVGDPCKVDRDCRHPDFDAMGVCLDGVCTCNNETAFPHPVRRLVKFDNGTVILEHAMLCVDNRITVTEAKINESCSQHFVLPANKDNLTAPSCSGDNVTCFECAFSVSEKSNPTCRYMNLSLYRDVSNESCIPMTTKEIAVSRLEYLCLTDNDCGFNEYCRYSPVVPACPYGICKCLDCATSVKVNGALFCMPSKTLALGDACTGSANEIYPSHAHCFDATDPATVDCKPMFMRRGSENECVPIVAGAKLGEACRRYQDECSSNLECNAATTCQCLGTASKWNSETSSCKHSSEGDACSVDSDCDDATAPTEGLKCLNGRCVCDAKFRLGQVKCLERKAESANESPESEECLRCPEDSDNTPCRNSNASGEEEETETCHAPEDEVSLSCPAPEVQTLGGPCRENSECGVNEECADQGFIPSCFTKQCRCKVCFEKGPEGVCSQSTEVALGQKCSNANNEFYGTGTKCNGSQVVCEECYEEANGGCAWNSPKQIGELCTSDCECITKKCVSPLMWADDNVVTITDDTMLDKLCWCGHRFEIWDEATQQCVMREFGDGCLSDRDCQANGMRGKGYTRTNGASCINGKCGCSNNYVPVMTSFLRTDSTGRHVAVDGSVIAQKTVCVHKSAGPFINAGIGSSCLIDPIFHADDPTMLAMGLCSPSSVCVQCPYGFASCRRINETAILGAVSREGCLATSK